ncbi:MAG: hypothetical protein IJT41_00805 [Clostridia bacterium]|nr:hypothetical protein [Clostridia bacterium]
MLKRILSVFLSVILAFCCILPVFASEKEAVPVDAPLVIVSGFGAVPLYLHPDSPSALQVFAPSAKTIVRNVSHLIVPLLRFVFTKDWIRLADETHPYLAGIFEDSLCDADGNSVHDVSVRTFPLSADHYPDLYLQDDRDEHGFVHTAIDALGGENVYFFAYDWRLDPMDHANDLHAFIESVKAQTGKDRIVLAACSMGGAITMAYLFKYGADDIITLLMENTAFQGISFVGKLFCGDYEADLDTLSEYLMQFVSWPKSIKNFATKLLKHSHLTNKLMEFILDMNDHNGERIAHEVMYPVFGNMPGMWAFVAQNEYEAAKRNALDADRNAVLIRRIDAYHYNVQQHAKDILDQTIASGCRVFVLVNYGQYGVPVSSARLNCNDYLIDASLASGGAVCAKIGQTLPDGYTQQAACGHNHISPDRAIDASSCMFPEITWFVHDMGHLDYPYGSESAQFLMWFVQADLQYTVHSDPRYPQFLQYNKQNKTLSPQ